MKTSLKFKYQKGERISVDTISGQKKKKSYPRRITTRPASPAGKKIKCSQSLFKWNRRDFITKLKCNGEHK